MGSIFTPRPTPPSRTVRLITAGVLALVVHSARAADSVSTPDMQSYLSRHDLTRTQPPEYWEDGFPLANGDIGAVVWGEGSRLIISLDKRDIVDTDPQSRNILPDFHWTTLVKGLEDGPWEEVSKIFSKSWQLVSHLPVGRIVLDFDSPMTGYEGRLNLANASAQAKVRFAEGSVQMRSFTHPNRNVVVMTLELEDNVATPQISANAASIDFARFRFSGTDERDFGPGGSRSYPEPQPYRSERAVGWRQTMLSGEQFLVRAEWEQTGPKQLTLLITITTSMEGPNPDLRARELLHAARRDTPAELWREHADWWKQYWERSFVALPDPRMEKWYYVGLYQLGSVSSPNKHWPMGLQTPWTPDFGPPVGAGRVHFDLPMYEWPTFTSNHLEPVDALAEWCWKYLPHFSRQGRLFGWQGPWVGCALGPDGTNSLMGDAGVSFWPGSGPWLAYSLWKRYLFTQDEVFLRDRCYPIMREFMKTYLGMLEKDDEGRWHLPWSNSPEFVGDAPAGPEESAGLGHLYNRLQDQRVWGRDVTCDMALIRFLGDSLIESAGILDIDDPELPRWRDVVEHLAPWPRGEEGIYVWEGQPFRHHRHLSHVFPIYPLHELSVYGTPEESNLIDRTMTQIRKEGLEWNHGWCHVYLATVYARLGDGDQVAEVINPYLDEYIPPTGIHTNAPYQRGGGDGCTLEPSLGFSALVLDMLLQSWGGTIRLFPAIPASWQNASFSQLRTEGAFLVSSRLQDGQVKFVHIFSEAGAPYRLINPYQAPAVVYRVSDRSKRRLSGAELQFSTRPDEAYLILPEDVPYEKADTSLSGCD